MTKKDYELFANELNILRAKLPEGTKLSFEDVIFFLGVVFQKDNPLFQDHKFRIACLEGKHIRKSIKTY